MKGGKRENAGRKKGHRRPETLEKAKVLAELRQRTMRQADRLFNAQYAKAVGSIQIFRVDEYEDENGKKKKEHVLLTDPDEIKQVLDDTDAGGGISGENYYLVTVVPPDNKAIDSLLDRTFGKAQQTVEVIEDKKRLTNDEMAYQMFTYLLQRFPNAKEQMIEIVLAEYPETDPARLLGSGEAEK